jgi:hypothetical protein
MFGLAIIAKAATSSPEGLPLSMLDAPPDPAELAPPEPAPAAEPATQPAGPAAPEPSSAAAAESNVGLTSSNLAAADTLEQEIITRLLKASNWPQRAIAALRLERFTCDQSSQLLARLLEDPSWQVRTFAVRALGRRHAPAQSSWFAAELEPRVLRTALRHRYSLDTERLGRGVRFLARSSSLEDNMLAAELGAASGDDELAKLAAETTRKVILRMGRTDAGSLTPRLIAITGAHEEPSPSKWQRWLMKTGRAFTLRPAHIDADSAAPLPPPLIAQLDTQRFADFEQYLGKLAGRSVDLAICIDCTARMGGEISQAQGGIDDLMIFAGDVIDSLRVGIVGYRDRRDRDFEVKFWDLTGDMAAARRTLWSLNADGGGDGPEAVNSGLLAGYSKLSWELSSTKVLVLIGDAPPHAGYGGLCVSMAAQAHRKMELTTHVIQAKKKDVDHFRDIARAGAGRCVSLDENAALVAEITGLTLGEQFDEEFREFFEIYLELCR